VIFRPHDGRKGIKRLSQAPVGYDQEDRQMMRSSTNTGRSSARAFRPAIEGQLEERVLLSNIPKGHTTSHFLLTHTKPRPAYNLRQPPFLAQHAPPFHRAFARITSIGTQTARGGQAVEVTAPDGSHYMISLSYTSNTLATNTAEGSNGQLGVSSPTAVSQQVATQSVSYPQPIGTVRAYAMSAGRVGLIVDGSTQNTDLTINPLGQPQKKGFAHSFAYGETNRNHVLNVGQITINSGQIGAIEGFQSAELSGPLVAAATGAINRIAFKAILPGASITTGGDLNTLDVLNGIDLSGAGTGIFVGRDLNLLNVGGNIQLSNGAVFSIGRNLGLVAQPPKGTGTGSNVLTLNFNAIQGTTITTSLPPSIGSYIQGNVVIDTAANSAFLIGNNIFNTMYIEGGIIGLSGLLVNVSGTPKTPRIETAFTSQPFGSVTVLQGASG
jgi:hypothetical protein